MNRPLAIKMLKTIVMIGVYGGLLLPLVFVPKVIFPFVFSKLLYFQILIGLTFPAYLVLAWIEPKFRPKWTPLYVAIAAYFVAVGLSVAFAVDVPRAWWGNQERMNGLFTLLHFFAWLTMMTAMFTTWVQWRKIVMFEIVLSVIMASVALLQIPFPKLLLFPAGPRVGGLLDNPIYMAAYQIFNLFFIALYWVKGASRPTKIWLAIAALVDIGAFVAAQSRGALLGVAAGLVILAVTYALMSPNKKAKRVVLGLTATFFLAYGALYALRTTDFVQKSYLARFTNLSGSTATRFIAWNIAWQGFLERPLTGWGFDDFHILFNLKYNPQSLRHGYYETWFDRAHNTVLDALSMIGILGTLTFFGIFGALFYSVYRAHKKGWIDIPTASIFYALPVAYFIQNLFVFDQPAGFTMSFFLYALIIAATRPEFMGVKVEEKSEKSADARVRAMPWIAFSVLQLAGVALIWRTSVLPAKASAYAIQSNSYYSAGLYDMALNYAKLAASTPTPYLDEQTFLSARNLSSTLENNQLDKLPNWREWHDLVVSLHERYFAVHPRNTNPLFVYARFLHSFSRIAPEDAPKAEQMYLAAIKTSPKRQQLYFSLSRFYGERGDKQKGYELFKEAFDFDPEVGESRWYVGLSLVYDLNKRDEGARELIRATSGTSPYVLKEVREAVVLADAYRSLNDKEGFKQFLPVLTGLPGGSLEFYFQIARDAEALGLIEERNRILGALERIYPGLAPRLAPLLKGSATSIDQALKMTENLVAETSTQAVPPPPSPAPSSGGSGPRK